MSGKGYLLLNRRGRFFALQSERARALVIIFHLQPLFELFQAGLPPVLHAGECRPLRPWRMLAPLSFLLVVASYIVFLLDYAKVITYF